MDQKILCFQNRTFLLLLWYSLWHPAHNIDQILVFRYQQSWVWFLKFIRGIRIRGRSRGIPVQPDWQITSLWFWLKWWQFGLDPEAINLLKWHWHRINSLVQPLGLWQSCYRLGFKWQVPNKEHYGFRELHVHTITRETLPTEGWVCGPCFTNID